MLSRLCSDSTCALWPKVPSSMATVGMNIIYGVYLHTNVKADKRECPLYRLPLRKGLPEARVKLFSSTLDLYEMHGGVEHLYPSSWYSSDPSFLCMSSYLLMLAFFTQLLCSLSLSFHSLPSLFLAHHLVLPYSFPLLTLSCRRAVLPFMLFISRLFVLVFPCVFIYMLFVDMFSLLPH